MAAKQQRLDRYLSQRLSINMRDVKPMLVQGRIIVDNRVADSSDAIINAFSHIVVDGQEIQRNTPRYIMLNKPAGVISATKDPEHPTVIALLGEQASNDLHIVGRLDRNSTGLLLITNDSRWSQALMAPEAKVDKVYIVELEGTIDKAYVDAFAKGIHFPYEGIVTRPANLEILGERLARVTLTEGRYHQIKRMFGHLRNRVIGLHRVSIGHITLDESLKSGIWRNLYEHELRPADY
jgi:16S rRNA pseudouridine516 synthase